MVAKQVIFRDFFEEEADGYGTPLGGIAIYEGEDNENLILEGVICGECGGWIDAEDCEILEVLNTWWTLDEAIKDNFKPDGTRGFRLDNQIRMELD